MTELADGTGLRLHVADHYRRAPELELGSVRLAAQVETWDEEDSRPTMLVSVDELPVGDATPAQLGARAVADEIALGHHVVACNPWNGLGEERRRRDASRIIVSIWAQGQVTVEQWRYVAPLDDAAVTIVVRSTAGHHHLFAAQLAVAVSSLRDRPIEDELDDVARGHGHAAAPPAPADEPSPTVPTRASEPDPPTPVQPRTRPPGSPVGPDDVDALRRGRPRRRADTARLRAAELIDGERRLTPEGARIHEVLRHPMRRFDVVVLVDGDPQVRELSAFLTSADGLVLADAPPGTLASGRTLTAIPSMTLADVVVRWLGIVPGTPPRIGGDGDDELFAVPARRLRARFEDAATPPPDDASAALRKIWADRWWVVRLTTSQQRVLWPSLVITAAAGVLRVVEDGARVLRITPEDPRDALALLLRFCGHELGGEWARVGRAS